MKNLKKLIGLLTPQERKQAGLLFAMILVMALLDALGVASIMPFVAVLSNPQLVESNATLLLIYKTFGFVNEQTFLIALGVMVFVFLLLSLSFKALTTYVQLRFTLMREFSISKRLVEGYLNQTYAWFLNRHSADLAKSILSEVYNVIHRAMLPVMTVMAQSAVVISLVVLLLVVDPYLTFVVISVLSLAYGLIYRLMRNHLNDIGIARVLANQARFTAVSEAFGAIKEVKTGGLEHVYIKRFSEPAELYARHQATAQVVGQLPRFALEAIAFGGMVLVMITLIGRNGSFGEAMPLIAVYAFAGYRLMPALQQVYNGLTEVRFASPAISDLFDELEDLDVKQTLDSRVEELPLRREIKLANVQFSYPKTSRPALREVSLTIPAFSSIGLVGATGSGKSTLVDLILGLLEPEKGELLVDGKKIDITNCRPWQASIGYVPQHIYLTDESIASNIAFGVRPLDINFDAIVRAAKIADLHDFIISELLDGYDTIVGERGVRLSGGQRQRLGIARALYHNPKVLILDEATSALDNITEQVVMGAVSALENQVTIIQIAHRLSTVRNCDRIYLLDKGRIVAYGSYSELIEKSSKFAEMVKK